METNNYYLYRIILFIDECPVGNSRDGSPKRLRKPKTTFLVHDRVHVHVHVPDSLQKGVATVSMVTNMADNMFESFKGRFPL